MNAIAAITAIVLFCGCTSVQPDKAKKDQLYVPDFVDFFPRHKGFVFGVDSAVGANAVVAKNMADKKALFQVTYALAQKTVEAANATFVKAQINIELVRPFLDDLGEQMLQLTCQDARIDRREYMNETVYSLAKCEYSPYLIKQIKERVDRVLQQHTVLYTESIARQLISDLHARIDQIEEY